MSREDISHIDLKNILLLSHDAIGPDTMERMISEIQINKKKYKVTKAIKLPPLIFLDRSVNYFTSIDPLPNFVTKETVVAEIVFLSTVNASKVNLSGKIVLQDHKQKKKGRHGDSRSYRICCMDSYKLLQKESYTLLR